MTIPLTARQLELLRYIAGYHRAHDGISPTLRECATALGIAKSHIHELLGRLEERGLIRRLYNKPRAIEVLVPVTIPTAPDGAPLHAVALPAPAGQPRA